MGTSGNFMAQPFIETFDFDSDPLELVKLLGQEDHVFFLDSGERDPSRARFSFIGFDPFDVVEYCGEDSLDRLKKKFMQVRELADIADIRQTTPLPAGAVGCLSYDGGLYQEHITRRIPDDMHLPDCFFGFYDCIVTIDHFAGKLHVISTGLPEKTSTAREQKARSRLKEVVGKIAPFFKGARAIRDCRKNQDRPGIFIPRESMPRAAYLAAVRRALDYIGRGDIYQVNLSRRFQYDFTGHRLDPAELYAELRRRSPAPFGGYLDCGSFQVISNSPERFLHLNGRVVQTRPMKGTRPRGDNAGADRRMREELINSPKETAELLMITDLLRNDLGKVCEYGTVAVKEMRTLEEYPYVYQMTSTVEGLLSGDKDGFDVIRACFPGGSITGCPKIRAMEIIEELEEVRRGMYTGTMGYISFNGDMDMNILIRTMIAKGDQVYVHAGGGIVADSVPEQEYAEILAKTRVMRETMESYGNGGTVKAVRA